MDSGPRPCPPLAHVRKRLRIGWYRSPVERDGLRLTQRSDLQGWRTPFAVVATGTLTYLLFANGI